MHYRISRHRYHRSNPNQYGSVQLYERLNVYFYRGSRLNLARVRRQAEIEIFKIERDRENIKHQSFSVTNQSLSKSVGSINEMSDTASVTSNTSATVGGIMTPRAHLKHLTILRKNILNDSKPGLKPSSIHDNLQSPNSTRLLTITPQATTNPPLTDLVSPRGAAISPRTRSVSPQKPQEDEAISELRRKLQASKRAASQRVKSSFEIELEIEKELDKLNAPAVTSSRKYSSSYQPASLYSTASDPTPLYNSPSYTSTARQTANTLSSINYYTNTKPSTYSYRRPRSFY